MQRMYLLLPVKLCRRVQKITKCLIDDRKIHLPGEEISTILSPMVLHDLLNTTEQFAFGCHNGEPRQRSPQSIFLTAHTTTYSYE